MSFLKRILLVEDDADVRAICSLALEAAGGFTLKCCSSARKALAVAPLFAPDLILLDVVMEEMDGPSALTAFRALPAIASTPIVFLTARVQPSELAEYRSLGCLGVIPKPFDPTCLAEALRDLWSGR